MPNKAIVMNFTHAIELSNQYTRHQAIYATISSMKVCWDCVFFCLSVTHDISFIWHAVIFNLNF